MPTFAVRFKGMITKSERERLTAAGVEFKGKEAALLAGSPETGQVATGRPIYTVAVEAESSDAALAKVREAMEPDTSNFSGWEAGPA